MAEALKIQEVLQAIGSAASGQTNGLVYDTAGHGSMADETFGVLGPTRTHPKWNDGADFFPLYIPFTRMQQAVITFTDGVTGNSCFQSNLIFSPAHVVAAVWHGVPSPIACQLYCQIVGDMCNYFTYIRNNLFPQSYQGSCFLKTYKQPAHQSWQDEYLTADVFQIISGPKKCSSNPTTNTIPETVHEPIVSVAGCPSSPARCADMNALPFGVLAVFDQRCGTRRIDRNICSAAAGMKCCAYCNESIGFAHKCFNDCYRSNIDYAGGTLLHMQHAGVPSAAHCHTLCLTNPSCTHFLFFQPKSISASVDYTGEGSTVGGGCVLRKYNSQEILHMDTSGALEGVDSQTQHVQTVFGSRKCPGPSAVFNSDTIPSQDDDDGWPYDDLSSTSTLSPTTTKNPCLYENLDYFGYDLARRQVPDAVVCKKSCQAHDSCLYFTFVPYLEKFNCLLKGAGAANKKIVIPRHVSGERCCSSDVNCPPPSEYPCISMDTDYFGFDIRSILKTGSPEDCQTHCLGESACLFWTYLPAKGDDDNSVCHLKSAKVHYGYLDGFVSGRRVCPGDLFGPSVPSLCFIPNVHYYSEEDYTLISTARTEGETASTAHACQVLCQNRIADGEFKCNFFSFKHSSESDDCYLYSKISEIEYNIGAVSGPKVCGIKPDTETPSRGVGYDRQNIAAFTKLSQATEDVDFKNPEAWNSIKVFFKEASSGCLPDSATECWVEKDKYSLPLKFRIQAILNPWGIQFSSWKRYSGYLSKDGPKSNYEDYERAVTSEFVVIDMVIDDMVPTGEIDGGYSVPIDGTLPAYWPPDWDREGFSSGKLQLKGEWLDLTEETGDRGILFQLCIFGEYDTVVKSFRTACTSDIPVHMETSSE